MSKILKNVQALICKLEVRISDHGYDELSSDNLYARDVIEGVTEAIVVEDLSGLSERPLRAGSPEGQGETADTCCVGNTERACQSSCIDYGL